MPRSFVKSRADVLVTSPDGTVTNYEKAAVQVRGGIARLSHEGSVVTEQTATTVEVYGRQNIVTLSDGTIWTVSRSAGCGCGGRRGTP